MKDLIKKNLNKNTTFNIILIDLLLKTKEKWIFKTI